MSDEQLNSALNLMRRMPPSSIENSLAGLIELVPDLTDDLLNHVDQPLKIRKDPKSGKEFILCDYNRDGDSYRSPWSNTYVPDLDDGFLPTQRLRAMEVEANNVFDIYRKQYFDTGYSSVYFFTTSEEKDDSSFGACFLIHKDLKAAKGLTNAWWDSIHVFEVTEGKTPKTFDYKLTSTVMISLGVENDKVGAVDLSGSMTQQSSSPAAMAVDADHPHIMHMGKMIEEMELKIRNQIEAVYIQKTREVINGMRMVNAARDAQWQQITQSLNEAVLKHGASRKKDTQ